MRIIGGVLKGKKISLPSNKSTRPLKDLVKESIFNILDHSNKFDLTIKNSNILDLFSGTGSFGFECISRGSKKITFIENYDEALKILKKNINHLKVNDKCEIINQDIFKFINSEFNFNDKFDLIFIDPPYKNDQVEKLIKRIKNKEILDKKGVIIIHRHRKNKDNLSNCLNILEERVYGISKLIIGF